MAHGNSKKVLVIKGIKSSIIDEAIVFLKDGIDPAIIDSQLKKNNNYLIKEAENIIENYIREIRKNNGFNINLASNLLSSRRKRVQNFIINASLVGSIILLLIMILRFL